MNFSTFLLLACLLSLTATSRFLQDQCQGDYWVDPTNDNQFYQCDNGVPVLKQCPVGLVFRDNVCNWPVPCPTGAYFPVSYDKTKFIQCANGEFVLQVCPTETVWNQDILTCDWAK